MPYLGTIIKLNTIIIISCMYLNNTRYLGFPRLYIDISAGNEIKEIKVASVNIWTIIIELSYSWPNKIGTKYGNIGITSKEISDNATIGFVIFIASPNKSFLLVSAIFGNITLPRTKGKKETMDNKL